MGLVFCLTAFAGAIAFSQRGLGHGLGFVLAVGCLYGWLRANFLDGVTHFCFDAALVGLYLNVLPRLRLPRGGPTGWISSWTAVLFSWPFIVVLLTPFLDAQHVLVQLVGLRTAVLFVPLLLVGCVINERDLGTLGKWAEWCVVGVSCFALLELIFGIEPFYPINQVTKILYISNDIAGGFYRIPASFSSAHAYGGTMVALLPLLLSRLEDRTQKRMLTAIATGLALIGVFACGARQSVIILAVVVAGTMVRTRLRPATLVVLFVIMGGVGYTVSQSERLRRFETLADPEFLEQRVTGSVNMGFWDVLGDYPLGKGLGSAVGTSIPFFLSEYARPQVGIENEYSRLLLDEGLPGLLIWIAFVVALLVRSAPTMRFGGSMVVGMWIVCASTWASGLIGTGLLASVPGTMLLMLYMGELARTASAEQNQGVNTHLVLRQQRARLS